MRSRLGSGGRGAACTRSYTFHALTDDRFIVMVGCLNLDIQQHNSTYLVSLGAERLGLVSYKN